MKRLVIILFMLAVGPFVVDAQKLDMSKLKGIKPRNIGPAGMSGRVTAFDAVHANPDIIYAGTASGGLWKSSGGGVSWKPIFDDQKVASIGAIAIYQKNPDIIYVGTGEGNPRNSQNMGGGVYKSLDGGKTWQFLGLELTRTIHRLYVHPEDPNTVWVGAQGNAWGDTPERGVYKSTDGGKNWRKVLFVNNRTGIADLIVDPTNPDKMIAAMWEYRRWPWQLKSGGPGSGLHITYDGGETWKKLTSEDGLPKGELGKIGLAFAPSSPNIVYATVEAKKNAIYKSTDGGNKWKKVQDKQWGSRPFYYGDIHVDPKNENRVYLVHNLVDMSIDGGKTFETILPFAKVHVDHHAWWIHPEDPSLIFDGNDGGMFISRDRGESWRFVENLPVGQFYHVAVDMAVPYNVMGGMQDNGSWRGPSNSLHVGGIRNGYWAEIAFGDGFDAIPDPANPRYGYGMSQGGFVSRLDFETGHGQLIKPAHPDGEFLRFHWNSAIAQDPYDDATIYYGSQYVHKSTDNGQSWTIISPDLTTNDPAKQKFLDTGGLTFDVTGAENHTSILAISPSPVEQGVIWVGTDDGNIQVTRDNGETWTNTSPRIKGMPKGAWVAQVKASTYNGGEAMAIVNNYRQNDWTPMLYHTTDYGRTWTNLVSANAVDGYTLAIAQDPVEPNLIFLGTEFGLYVSIDKGKNWSKWTEGYPTVSTMDLVIHPREHDLVIGTFGRTLWIIDDIRPIRAIAQQGTSVLDQTIVAFDTPDTYNFQRKQADGTRFFADAIYRGEDKPDGALISYAIRATSKQDTTIKSDTVKIQISNSAGDVIRNLTTMPKEPGVNRFTWNLTRKGVRFPGSPRPKPNAPEPGGPKVGPGTYTVTMTYAGTEVETTVHVKADPRIERSATELKEMTDFRDRLISAVDQSTSAIDKLNEAKKAMESAMKMVPGGNEEGLKATKEQSKEIGKKIKELKELITAPEDVQGIYRDPSILSTKLGELSFYLGVSRFGGSFYHKPTPNQEIVLKNVEKDLSAAMGEINTFFDGDWKSFREEIEKLNPTPFKELDSLE